MLTIHAGWDWFHEEMAAEELQAIQAGRLYAVVREDGDDNAAIVAAVKGVNAPGEFVELETLDPMIGDCFLAVAWDKRFIEVVMDDDVD